MLARRKRGAPKRLAGAAVRPADVAANKGSIRKRILPRPVPRSEEYRTRFGRSLDLGRIESALRDADCGYMVRLCDMERETLSLDAHALSLCTKRFGAIQALDWTVKPASGPGIDKKLAVEIAAEVREQIARIPSFGARLRNLAWGAFDGRAALEIHWDYAPMRARAPWRVRCLEWVHPRRLSFNQPRELLVIDTLKSFGNFGDHGLRLADHPGKFLWWMPQLFDEYPEHEGLGPRTLYWTFFKRFSWRHRMMLTELFGMPWRIITADADSMVDGESLEEAEVAAEQLGRETTARFPAGVNMDVEWPHEHASEIHRLNATDVNDELSKLFLGNTGTTDNNETNRANGIVARGEQDIILHMDGSGISERATDQLALPITVLNYGADAAPYCPSIVLETSPPRDQKLELDLATQVISLGVPVTVDELREKSGTREPEEDEAVVRSTGGGGVDAMGNPIAPTTSIYDPMAKGAPTVDEIAEDAGSLEEGGTAEAQDNADKDDPLAAWRRGARELAALRGRELTDDALAALSAMPPNVRDRVLESVIVDDVA